MYGPWYFIYNKTIQIERLTLLGNAAKMISRRQQDEK